MKASVFFLLNGHSAAPQKKFFLRRRVPLSSSLRLSLALEPGTVLFLEIEACRALVVRIARGAGRPFLPACGRVRG